MTLAREYYPSQVLTILRERDHRLSPYNGQPGHCLSKHVLISTDGLAALAALDAGTYPRVSIVGPTPSKLFGSTELADIGVRQSERVGSVNAFKNAPAKQHGVTHNENLNVQIAGGALNMWVLVDRIDANNIHIHTASPSDPADTNRPIGWEGKP